MTPREKAEEVKTNLEAEAKAKLEAEAEAEAKAKLEAEDSEDAKEKVVPKKPTLVEMQKSARKTQDNIAKELEKESGKDK